MSLVELISLPGPNGRRAVAVAVVTWLGTILGLGLGQTATVPIAACGAVMAVIGLVRRNAVLLLSGGFLVAGIISGAAAAQRIETTLSASIPRGTVTVQGRVTQDAIRFREQRALLLDPDAIVDDRAARAWNGPRLLVVGPVDEFEASARIEVSGRLSPDPRRVRGDPVAGRLDAVSVRLLTSPTEPIFSLGNALRRRVHQHLADHIERPEAALLSGFLIGDVADLPPGDIEALRRTGLSHYVAVSGSNVALFLSVWWLATAPLAVRPGPRAVVGLFGLAIFVVATRWEASVLRAAVMVALILVGRRLGLPLGGWEALAAAVTLLLITSGHLAVDPGFQLSVAATAGILAGVGLFAGRRPRWAWATLGATISAQIAVVPLLLSHFGSVPLLSPLSNVLAAPLVVVATMAGGIGVLLGFQPLLDAAVLVARAVLEISRFGADWPQLGWAGVTAAATAAVVWQTRLRAAVLVAAVFALTLWMAPIQPPRSPTVVFLDVGQGDAVLLQDPSGRAVLIDGGRYPDVLRAALGRYGVGRLDLLVVTHGDDDHVGGLADITDSVAVQRLWHSGHPRSGRLLPDVAAAVTASGGLVEVPSRGAGLRLGAFTIEVLGPRRRYMLENDGSVVLWISVCDRSFLLAGDIEAVAQRELPQLGPDVLLVPHHGSATTDLAWLDETVGPIAVISVGENTYGHPAAGVLETLQGASAEVHSTEDEGDVRVACPS